MKYFSSILFGYKSEASRTVKEFQFFLKLSGIKKYGGRQEIVLTYSDKSETFLEGGVKA